METQTQQVKKQKPFNMTFREKKVKIAEDSQLEIVVFDFLMVFTFHFVAEAGKTSEAKKKSFKRISQM